MDFPFTWTYEHMQKELNEMTLGHPSSSSVGLCPWYARQNYAHPSDAPQNQSAFSRHEEYEPPSALFSRVLPEETNHSPRRNMIPEQ